MFPIRLDLNDLRVQRFVETRRCRQRVDELREHAVRVGEKEALVAKNPARNVTRALLSITPVRSVSSSTESRIDSVLQLQDGHQESEHVHTVKLSHDFFP